jgi:hypothetical protein
MAQIQPVKTWFQGKQREANVFSLYNSGNNLIDSATFQYQLIELTEDQNSQTLISGELVINGQDYIDWTSSVDANYWIYQWAANKLGLTIITL